MIITNGLPKEKNLSNRGAQGVAIFLSPEAQSAWVAAGSIIHDDCGSRVIAVRIQVKDPQNRDMYVSCFCLCPDRQSRSIRMG